MQTQWRQSAPGQYIDLEWRHGDIYIEDGPDAWPKRGHEGVGGTFALQEIRRRGRELFSAYDGLYERLFDDLAPQLQVSDAPLGVVATLDGDLAPCATPCRFAFNGSKVYVYPVTTAPSEHVTAAPQASLVITAPGDDDTTPFFWARIQGEATVVDDPEWELDRAAELFAEKYGDLAAVDPDDVPTIRIDIDQWTSHPNRGTEP